MARTFGALTALEQRVLDIAGAYLAPEGIGIFDVEHSGQGGQQVLRVAITREGGVTLDLCADASAGLSRILDEQDVISGRYVLEVSSPGLERHLRTPVQFADSVGDLVRVKTRAEIEGQRTHEGVLSEVDGTGATLKLADGRTRRLDFPHMASARTVFEWVPQAEQKQEN